MSAADEPAGSSVGTDLVEQYFAELQVQICSALGELEGGPFDDHHHASERGGESRPRVISDGRVLERAAVIHSRSSGATLPATLVERRPELDGRGYQATSISVVVHPRNPYAPTAHMNLRFFLAPASCRGHEPIWWFGGGFDLTPCYGFRDDAEHWHRAARHACEPFGKNVYPRLKKACDEYFYLPHRGEPRGIGGIFFEDMTRPDPTDSDSDSTAIRDESRLGPRFEPCFSFVRSVGDSFLPAYLPILQRRIHLPYEERQRAFQLYRRGRYAEFNLAIDRGTRYGLTAGVRTESVLASLPPLASWKYDWTPEPGSDEERLVSEFLIARDWLEPTDG